MAMVKPIITTDVPRCKETVCHGVNGFLTEPNNPESLAAAMKAFLSLPIQRKIEMGIQSRTIVEERFDEKKVIEKYLEMIEVVYDMHSKKKHKTAMCRDQIGAYPKKRIRLNYSSIRISYLKNDGSQALSVALLLDLHARHCK